MTAPSTSAQTVTTTQRPALAQPVTSYVRAVIVTGEDSQGNEFAYQWTENGWHNLYSDYVLDYGLKLEPTYVRFGDLQLSPREWEENGCPLRLPAMDVEQMKARRWADETDAANTAAAPAPAAQPARKPCRRARRTSSSNGSPVAYSAVTSGEACGSRSASG